MCKAASIKSPAPPATAAKEMILLSPGPAITTTGDPKARINEPKWSPSYTAPAAFAAASPAAFASCAAPSEEHWIFSLEFGGTKMRSQCLDRAFACPLLILLLLGVLCSEATCSSLSMSRPLPQMDSWFFVAKYIRPEWFQWTLTILIFLIFVVLSQMSCFRPEDVNKFDKTMRPQNAAGATAKAGGPRAKAGSSSAAQGGKQAAKTATPKKKAKGR